MARMTLMDYQMHLRMEELKCIGQSRHQAKIEYKEINGGCSHNNKTVGIHSYKTYQAYKQTSIEVIRYIRNTHSDISNINQITKEIAIEFLKSRQDSGCSAYTTSKDMAALNKLLNLKINKRDAGLMERSYKDVTRSRLTKESDFKYNPKNYEYQIVFAKASGCRRQSMLKVYPENFTFGKDGLPNSVHLKEKGGRERNATIVVEYRQILKEYLEGKKEGIPLFAKYTKKIDNHAFRAEYAKKRYQELVFKKGEDKRDYRGFDRECLEKLTLDMGHNRLDVVIYHYLH